MPQKAPSFTLPLAAFSGLSDQTNAALERLFGEEFPAGALKALVMRPHGTINSSNPHDVGFLYQNDEGELTVASAFKTPQALMEAGASAAYMLSHDPKAEALINGARMARQAGSVDRIAVTAFGAIAWDRLRCHALKGNEHSYQDKLEKGGAIIALMATGKDRSAHQRIEDSNRFGPLAAAVYRAEMAALSKNKRTGLHRTAQFCVSSKLRNPQLWVHNPAPRGKI